MKKAKSVGNDEMQDGGEPVVKADAAKSPTDVAAEEADEISGDPQQKGEGKPDPMPKLKKVKSKETKLPTLKLPKLKKVKA